MIFLTFGPLLTAAAGYTLTGALALNHWLIGIPAGLSTTAIIWINQFPDFEADRNSGKKNWVVRLGLRTSSRIYLILMSLILVSLILLAVFRIYSLVTLAVLLLTPIYLKASRNCLTDYETPQKILPVQGMTIQLQLLSGIITLIGLLSGIFIRI